LFLSLRRIFAIEVTARVYPSTHTHAADDANDTAATAATAAAAVDEPTADGAAITTS
jgi:hypothetical protein